MLSRIFESCFVDVSQLKVAINLLHVRVLTPLAATPAGSIKLSMSNNKKKYVSDVCLFDRCQISLTCVVHEFSLHWPLLCVHLDWWKGKPEESWRSILSLFSMCHVQTKHVQLVSFSVRWLNFSLYFDVMALQTMLNTSGLYSFGRGRHRWLNCRSKHMFRRYLRSRVILTDTAWSYIRFSKHQQKKQNEKSI